MKLLKLTTSDGYVFFEQSNGIFTDTQNGKNYDLSFANYQSIVHNDFIDIVKFETYN